MAPLPPPPPPAPPPPPLGGPVAAPSKNSKSEAMDRNALLSQIRGGPKLKKATVVNDRSAPLVDGKSSKTSSGVGSKPISNGPGGAPMQLGGLFAGGIPKLKSTGSKLVSNGLTVSANKVNNSCTKSDQTGPNKTGPTKTGPTGPTKTDSVRSLNTSSLKTSLEEKLTNNSSFLHNSKISSSNNSSYELNYNNNNNNKFYTMKAREKPSYVTSEHKGQAPQVPTQTIDRSNAPELPKKPPGVQRSNSQSSGRISSNTGRRPGPPNIKPPPPPKMTNGLSSQSLQPTQSLNINRRQSFTDEKSNSSAVRSGRPDVSALVSNLNQQLNRTDRPPAPLRNVNPVVNGVSQSPAYPPPPPPVSTIPNRPNNSGPRMQTIKSNAPNIPIQVQKTPSNFRPPLGPPPPPPHRTTSNNTPNCPLPPPPPPSQTKVIPTTMRNGSAFGPPPPVRNTSMSRDETSFASRFQQFKAVFELPAPTPPTISNKQYPSHMQQSQRRRDPPPPPPQSNGMVNHSPNLNAHNNYGKKLTNPVLHIQIGSTAAQS